MDWEQKVVIVTGGAKGIGAALVTRMVDEGAAAVIVSDLHQAGADAVAEGFKDTRSEVIAISADIGVAEDVARLVSAVEDRFGRVDVVCSNAGLMTDGNIEVPDEAWSRTWDVNVMAHVRVARAALPGMIRRQEGYFVNVASAAGLLTAPGAAAYTATKHAAVGFAEWLAITYGDQGIGVSVVCPGPVATDMLSVSMELGNEGVRKVAKTSEVLQADDVARIIIEGVKADRFLIVPHGDTIKNVQRKWSDLDRWIGGMRAFLRSAN